MAHENPTPGRRPRLLKARPVWDFLAETYTAWRRHQAQTLGAALAFYITFSMAPLLIVITAVFGAILGQAAIQAEILRQAQELIGEQGAATVKLMFGAAYLRGSGLAATLIGISVLLIGSTSAFVMLRQALNFIWGAPLDDAASLWHLVKDRLLCCAMIMLFGLLIVVSLLLSLGLTFLTGFFKNLLPLPPFSIQAADFMLSLFLLTLLFALTYKVLPDVDIAWTDVWIGAAITAVLFTLGKFLFGLYLARSAISSAYGAASSLAILLMWVFYSAQIFFIGAEITQVYANRYGSRVKPRNKKGGPAGPPPY
ncbi:MAG: YihY/virulence factor BrkB family protein [Syntrophobacterales bacterium]|jgi:membrane protein|nr:YihY/virulence factor BrkB family protein [Syntrophobacterales bacterium]